MTHALPGSRPVPLGTRLAAVLAAPLAPLFGLLVAYLSLAQAQLLHRAGYTVVLFDFRNHGASFRDHGLTRFSRHFNDDLMAVVHHLRAMPEHAHARIAFLARALKPVSASQHRVGGP
jgi:pimeloyl-ACP methyl ester carboxylesterase